MNRVAKRSGIVILLALLLIAGLGFFVAEYAAEAGDWVLHSGSPHVYSGGNIGCGAVTDRNGVLILDLNNDRSYSSNALLRMATVHWVGDRNGSVSAPAIASYAEELLGYDRIGGVYRYGSQGGVAKLTLSAAAQEAAMEAMDGLKGTVAVYNYRTGEILCAVTTPSFDPDNVPDIAGDTTGAYDGVYVNRFTRSVYIPGSIYKTVTLAAALETIPDLREQTFTCTGKYQIGTESITCEIAHGKQNIQQAFGNSCNCAFSQVVEQLGGGTLEEYVEKLGVARSVSFDGITTAPGNFSVEDAGLISVAWSGIGQYKDQVNPCVFMTYMGAIASGGQGVNPYIVKEIKIGNRVTYQAEPQLRERILSQETAELIQQYMRLNVTEHYGDENFPDMQVCAKTGTAQVGGDKTSNAVFAGFLLDEDAPLAFFICIEEYGYGRTCIPIMSKILTVCKVEILS